MKQLSPYDYLCRHPFLVVRHLSLHYEPVNGGKMWFTLTQTHAPQDYIVLPLNITLSLDKLLEAVVEDYIIFEVATGSDSHCRLYYMLGKGGVRACSPVGCNLNLMPLKTTHCTFQSTGVPQMSFYRHSSLLHACKEYSCIQGVAQHLISEY